MGCPNRSIEIAAPTCSPCNMTDINILAYGVSLWLQQPQYEGLYGNCMSAYCYALLINEKHRAAIVNKWPPFVTRSTIEYLLTHHPEYANTSAFYKMTLSRPPGLKKGETLLHISITEQRESAMTYDEVLRHAPYGSIFGLDVSQPSVQTPDAPTQQTGPTETMFLRAPSAPDTVTLLLLVELASNKKYTFSPTLNEQLALVFLIYESVHLLDYYLDVELDQGKAHKFHFAVTTTQKDPQRYRSAPIYHSLYGSDLSGTKARITESSANFGKEIKAPALGNPPPHFHFHMQGGTSSDEILVVRMFATFKYAGRGVIPAINLTQKLLTLPQSLGHVSGITSAPTDISL